MQILARHALQFDHPTDPNIEPVIVKYQDIVTVPDWVKESSMFKQAKAAEWLVVFGEENINLADAKVAEAKVYRGSKKDEQEAVKNIATV